MKMSVNDYRDGIIMAKRHSDRLLYILKKLESYEIPTDITELNSFYKSLGKLEVQLKKVKNQCQSATN